MDTNDYRSNDGREESGSSYPQQQPSEQPQNTQYGAGYGYYGYGGANYGQYPPNPGDNNGNKKKGVMRALVALLLVVCLVAGGVFTHFVISPFIEGISTDGSVAQAASRTPAPRDEATEPPDEQSSAAPTSTPQIGGQSPDIDYSQSPIVQIAQQVRPAVVSVRIDVPTTQDEYDPAGNRLCDPRRRLYRYEQPRDLFSGRL